MTQSRSLFALAGVLALVAAAAAQEKPKPNFSGRWVAVSPADSAGQEQVVKHEGMTLSTSHAAEGPDHVTVLTLDGSESRNELSDHGQTTVARSKASWKGSQIVIDTELTYADGRLYQSKQTWSLDPEGRLVIEGTVTVTGRDPINVKLVYTKK